MIKPDQLLSDIVVFTKYSRIKEELGNPQRKMNWVEIVDEYLQMMVRQYPNLEDEIISNGQFIKNKKVFPSMRALQYSGIPIENNHARMYNCSGIELDNIKVFSEIMFLSLSGCGVGVSLKKRCINKLPPVIQPSSPKKFRISDSVEGWSDAIRILMYSYFRGNNYPTFDFSDIRPKGSLIKKLQCQAPGSEKLQWAITKIDIILKNAIGRQLTDIECLDIVDIIAYSVVSGGIRSAAIIVFADKDSTIIDAKSVIEFKSHKYLREENGNNVYEIITKDGLTHEVSISSVSVEDIALLRYNKIQWYHVYPHRAMSNNSISERYDNITENEFKTVMKKSITNGTGEPGILFTNEDNVLSNPCGEIVFESESFCNLTTINAYNIESQEDFDIRSKIAAFFGTLQAGFTDFHYIRYSWKEKAEKQALLGVSITGIAGRKIENLDEAQAAKCAVEENERIANLIGINPADRVTCIKPEGSTTLVAEAFGAGVHSAFAEYYTRRIRIQKAQPIAKYLKEVMPDFIEDDLLDKTKLVLSLPMKSDDNCITENESPIELLERNKRYNINWIRNGHHKGSSYNNVSATVSVDNKDVDEVINWIWENRKDCAGLTLLPKIDNTYQQTPFEKIDKEQYEYMISMIPEDIDLSKVGVSINKETTRESACSGGSCEIHSI